MKTMKTKTVKCTTGDEVELKCGQWWKSMDGAVVFISGLRPWDKEYPFSCHSSEDDGEELYTDRGYFHRDERDSGMNLAYLLPADCDSFDYEEAEPSCPAHDCTEDYRLLAVGEIIQLGDQFQFSQQFQKSHKTDDRWNETHTPGEVVEEGDIYRRPLALALVGVVPGGRLFFLAD